MVAADIGDEELVLYPARFLDKLEIRLDHLLEEDDRWGPVVVLAAVLVGQVLQCCGHAFAAHGGLEVDVPGC